MKSGLPTRGMNMKASSLMVLHYVYDMQRAVAFYRDALSLPVVIDSSGFSILSCGDAIVALHMIEPGVPEGLTRHAGLCLKVDVLETAIADIRKAGGDQRAPIREAEPHVPVRVVEVQDSEGNAFELRQEV